MVSAPRRVRSLGIWSLQLAEIRRLGICSESRPPQTSTVILSEASRSFTARGAVEGPAVCLTVPRRPWPQLVHPWSTLELQEPRSSSHDDGDANDTKKRRTFAAAQTDDRKSAHNRPLGYSPFSTVPLKPTNLAVTPNGPRTKARPSPLSTVSLKGMASAMTPTTQTKRALAPEVRSVQQPKAPEHHGQEVMNKVVPTAAPSRRRHPLRRHPHARRLRPLRHPRKPHRRPRRPPASPASTPSPTTWASTASAWASCSRPA